MIKLITFPYYRFEIEWALEELVNKEKQHHWLDKANEYPSVYWHNLLFYCLDTLYNDRDLDEYTESNIGEIFYDEDEAEEVHKFCEWFYELTEKIGEKQPNEAYLNHPEWPKVYTGAKKVYDLMRANSDKYNLTECLTQFNNTPFEEWMKKFDDK